MKVWSSLRGRIFLASALLAVLSIGAAIYLVSVRVTRELENALQREIVATGALVQQLHTTRAQTFTMMARLIADAPTLKAAVDTNDSPTIQAALQDISNGYHDQLESNLLLVTSTSGQVMATVGASPDTALLVANQPSVRSGAAGLESFSLVAQPDGMLQLVTAPIGQALPAIPARRTVVGLTHPEILGALSVGFMLDDTLAGQLKQVTGSEIAFGMDGQIFASTLPPGARAGLSNLLHGAQASRDVTLGSEEYAVLPLPLASNDDTRPPRSRATALILRSRTEQLRFLREIHTELTVTALVAVLLATLLSFTVARTITRPLSAITDVMREVAVTGDLTRKIVLHSRPRWDDEEARLVATTFNTLTDSIARFQREMSQKERLSSLGRLSTVIAHEVRNPLMIIKAALHTLRQPALNGGALREAVTDIDEEVVRLNRVVNDVLDFARPIRFELTPTDINALCRESAAAAQAGPGPDVRLDLDRSLPSLSTDSERLRIALVNLIVNARQAVDGPGASLAAGVGAGGPRLPQRIDAGRTAAGFVTVSTHAGAATVTIVVADNGVGIDGADLARVFDPYFTTKRGGTGLGLPIAKNIIDGLGGAVTVTSAPGRGTEIRLELPLGAPPGTPAGSAPGSPSL